MHRRTLIHTDSVNSENKQEKQWSPEDTAVLDLEEQCFAAILCSLLIIEQELLALVNDLTGESLE